jgi:hypothetical protein
MGYELKCVAGETLSSSEVVRLLEAEFAQVNVDAEDGHKQAISRADWIEHAPPRLFLGRHQEVLSSQQRCASFSLAKQ